MQPELSKLEEGKAEESQRATETRADDVDNRAKEGSMVVFKETQYETLAISTDMLRQLKGGPPWR